MYIVWFDEIIGREMVEVRDIFHYVMPDRACTGNTNDIVHLAIIAFACPDPDGNVRGITHGPVVAETLCRTCFCGGRATQLEWIAGSKLMIAGASVRKNAAHQNGDIFKYSSHPLWLSCIVTIERMTLVISNF